MIASKYFIDWLLAAAADDTLSGAGPLDGAFVQLLTNAQVPNLNWTIADLEEANFPGYPAGGVEITGWTVPVNETSGARKIIGDAATFIATADTTPNTVTAFAVVNAGGTELLFAQKLAANWGSMTGASLVIIPAVALSRTLPDSSVIDAD